MSINGTTDFNIILIFRDHPVYTEVVFLRQNPWLHHNEIVPINDTACMAHMVNGWVTFSFAYNTLGTCDIDGSPDTVNKLGHSLRSSNVRMSVCQTLKFTTLH